MLRTTIAKGRQVEGEDCGNACILRYNSDAVEKVKPRQVEVEDCGNACILRYNSDVVEKVKS
jgi:hypothetical protein